MILVWRCPAPPVVTRWRGLDDETRAILQEAPLKPLAAIIGPKGDPGEDGQVGLPPVLDGGNF